VASHLRTSNVLSFFGLTLILFSIFVFNKTISLQGIYLLVPTLGATLIIVFAREGTLTHLLLGQRLVVFLGLLSYSLYLWHQPVFAYLRICSTEKPSPIVFGISITLVFACSYLSWKFFETPFRNKKNINQRGIFIFSIFGSIFFIAIGLYLNKSYGLPTRVFDPIIRVEDMDKRIYNERVFSFKKDAFSNSAQKKLLIVGNSFARDFTNITLETYDISNVEIIYRDDLGPCILPYKNMVSENLFSKADAIVFASGYVEEKSLVNDIKFASLYNKKIFYVGTKDFGYNLNWLIRLSENDRRNRYNRIAESVIAADLAMSKFVPSEYYISLLAPTLVSNKVPITDELGRMISTDRAHLTKYGSIYFGQKVVKYTRYSDFFKGMRNSDAENF